MCRQPSVNKNKRRIANRPVLTRIRIVLDVNTLKILSKMISRIVCLVLIVGLVNAATFMDLNPKKPKEFANRSGCYIKEINDVITYGEMVNPVGVCYSIDCSRHMIFYSSCGLAATTDSPNCYVTEEDLSVPYPRCCPEVKCEEDNYIV